MGIAPILLLAKPIPSPSLELHEFVFDNAHELGCAGSSVLTWRPIGNPRITDSIYQELRSPELAARDEQQAAEYEQACRKAGSEEHYVRGKYNERAAEFDIDLSDRPLVVLHTAPRISVSAFLYLDRRVFESRLWRGALAEALCHELSATRIGRLREAGVFTASSMTKLQIRLNNLRHQIGCALEADDCSRLLSARQQPSSVKPLLDPERYSHANHEMRSDGALILRVRTDGESERTVVFDMQNGKPTKQHRLMQLLCLCWPKPVSFGEGMTAVYGKDTVCRARGTGPELQGLSEKFRALLSDIRKKMDKRGINPDILPGESPFRASPGGLRLRLASLNGYKSQSEYDSLA